METSSVIGRFAPTPSGEMHLGNLLCAMLAWLSAKSKGGECLLRIEDVDIPRCPESNSLQLIHDLEWFGFEWDREILFQSKRSRIYAETVTILQQKQLVYPCFCTRAQLHQAMAPNAGDTQYVYPGTCYSLSPEKREALSAVRKPAYRLHVPDETVTFFDHHFGVVSENLAHQCGDYIILRSDGIWGYQIACVVDDALSDVNEVVRGSDILTATPRQIWLQHVLGYDTPSYRHIPLLTDAEGRRLAKRDKDIGVCALRKHYSPNEVLGLLANACGLIPEWESISWIELLKIFSWDHVPKNNITLPSIQ